MMEKFFLSVVIPAWNEEENLKKGVLEHVFVFLNKQKYLYEVIIVDDGSSDNTVALAEKLIADKKSFRIIKNRHGGKAVAVMTGLLAAKGEIRLFTDMDQATPLPEVAKLLPKFKEGYDIVIGTRTGRKGAPLMRKLSAWSFAILRNIILGLPFSDTQCGFKAFNSQAVRTIFPKMLERWEKSAVSGGAVNAGFDVEALFLAKKSHFRIAEVPVKWEYVSSRRVNLVMEAINSIKGMFKIRFNEFKGLYY